MEPLNYARSKAAAWAWYQRGAGSGATLATARTEPVLGSAASGPQCTVLTRGGSSPSRFKLEADLSILFSASMEHTSDRLKSLNLLPDSSDSSYGASDAVSVTSGMLTPPPMPPQMSLSASTMLADAADLSIVMSGYRHGTASWDCGSSLFDSFELVAMSKKLEAAHQLDEGAMEKVFPPVEDVSSGKCGGLGSNEDEDEDEEDEGTSTGLNALRLTPMNMNNSCMVDADSTDSNSDCKQSRQAIYDMFCQYENLETPIGSARGNEHVKKSPTTLPLAPRSSKQYRRRRFHSLSKAFRHHFVQLTRQSGRRSSIPIDSHRPSDKASLPSRIFPNIQTHDHRTVCGFESPVRRDRIKAELGCSFEASKNSLRKQYSSNDAHHSHHHNYNHHHHHYLFRHHSGDSLGLLPLAPLLDKSHRVAAAGLRASKVSSLHSLGTEGACPDSKRERGDANNLHVTDNFPMKCYAFPISQER